MPNREALDRERKAMMKAMLDGFLEFCKQCPQYAERDRETAFAAWAHGFACGGDYEAARTVGAVREG